MATENLFCYLIWAKHANLNCLKKAAPEKNPITWMLLKNLHNRFALGDRQKSQRIYQIFFGTAEGCDFYPICAKFRKKEKKIILIRTVLRWLFSAVYFSFLFVFIINSCVFFLFNRFQSFSLCNSIERLNSHRPDSFEYIDKSIAIHYVYALLLH